MKLTKLIKGEKAYLQIPVEVKSIDKELGTLEAIFSTQDVDRHGDIVMQEGWDLGNFKKNPVILNSHNYGDAAEVIGKASNVKIDGKKLLGKITFAVNENPKAKIIFDLYAGGFLSAFSVGFIPTEFKQNKDGTTDWYVIEKAELLEVSAVSVPANARALAKAKGIDVDELPPISKEECPDCKDLPEGEVAEGHNHTPALVEAPAEEVKEEDEEKPESEEEVIAEAPKDEEAEIVEVVPTPQAPEQASYAEKVAYAIAKIESKEKRMLRKTAEIINSLLHDEGADVRINKKTREQIRKRKVNQAIRTLFTLK